MQWRETLVVDRTGTFPSGEAAWPVLPHRCRALTLSGGFYPRAVLSDRNSVATHCLCRVTLQSARNREPGLNVTRTAVVHAAGMPPISSALTVSIDPEGFVLRLQCGCTLRGPCVQLARRAGLSFLQRQTSVRGGAWRTPMLPPEWCTVAPGPRWDCPPCKPAPPCVLAWPAPSRPHSPMPPLVFPPNVSGPVPGSPEGHTTLGLSSCSWVCPLVSPAVRLLWLLHGFLAT